MVSPESSDLNGTNSLQDAEKQTDVMNCGLSLCQESRICRSETRTEAVQKVSLLGTLHSFLVRCFYYCPLGVNAQLLKPTLDIQCLCAWIF